MHFKLLTTLIALGLLLTGCNKQHHPDYTIFKNVSQSQVSGIKKVIQEESIKGLELPTKMPYVITDAELPTPTVNPQSKHTINMFIGNKVQGRALEINASSYQSTNTVDRSIGLLNEQLIQLGDGTKAVYGNNGHVSQLAWVKNGVLYMMSSSNQQNKPDLTEEQLVQVADSFK